MNTFDTTKNGHIFDSLMRARLRHTRGSEQPIYLLLCAEEFDAIDTRDEEQKKAEKDGDRMAGMYFCGIRVIKSKLAFPNEPLAVMHG